MPRPYFKLPLPEAQRRTLEACFRQADHVKDRDLLMALRATPVVVVPDRLGAVNQARLVLEALPASMRKHAVVVLAERHGTGRTNAGLLAEWMPDTMIMRLAWAGQVDGEGETAGGQRHWANWRKRCAVRLERGVHAAEVSAGFRAV